MNEPTFLSGKLLLSMPGIGDPRFERVVIAMCLHDEEGALGIVVNTLAGDLTVRGLMEQLDIDPGVTPPEAMVMHGGPVEPGRGFVLHSAEYQGQSTISVGGPAGVEWGLTSTLDVLKDIAAGKGPAQWLAALGYTGWGAGQLDDEMTKHGWHVAPGDSGLLFKTTIETRWPAAFATTGIAVGQLSAEAGRA
ncbi:MAG: YqgE/AlgH family protein [Sandarakinorhabdus sp.]|nr:YqgE/AlgH family protein [Sandarakinorhabdus sp.]